MAERASEEREDATISSRNHRIGWRQGVVLGVLALLLMSTVSVAYAGTYNRSYDGCTWYLKTDRTNAWWLGIDISEARTQDVNGGCNLVTAKTREPDGTNVHVAGPSSNPYVIAVDDDGGVRQGYGRITTWEHGWYQYVGWVSVP